LGQIIRGEILHNVGNGWKLARIALLHSVEETLVFYLESFLGKSKMDKKNVQKRILPKYFLQNTCFVTIIEIYGLVTEKITQNL
jgi:hypothetical protein